MTLAQLKTLVKFINNVNDTTLSDANFLRLSSERHKQMTLELANINEGYAEETSLSNLVASTESYALPTNMMKLKRVEAQYDGVNWYPVTIYDINESDTIANDTTTIGNLFTASNPFGDILGNSIYLRPIPSTNRTNGLKFWYVDNPADFAATTETPAIPAEYHRLMADLVSIDIRLMKNEMTSSQAMREEQAILEVMKRQASPRTNEEVMMRPANINYE